MTWVVVILVALAAFLALAFLLRAPRKGWEAIGAALLFGLAGFVQQARTDLPGAPKAAAESLGEDGSKLVELRRAFMANGPAPVSNRWLVTSDGLTRGGQYGDAAGLALGAVEHDPRNAEAWLALGNDLTAHAQGTLTPAALYAYRQAAQAAPGNPGPPFFLGIALAQSGRFEEARQVLGELQTQTPADAPWREFVSGVVARLDAMLAKGRPAPPASAQ